MDRMV